MKASALPALLACALLLSACAPLDTGAAAVDLAHYEQPTDVPGLPWRVIPLDTTPLPERPDKMQPHWVQLDVLPQNPAAGCFDNCHQEMLAQAGAFVHQPFAAGECQPCHTMPDDHAEAPSAHTASMQDIEVCLQCHTEEELGASHPVDDGMTDPVTGGLFTCTSTCHDPHTAPFEYLLRYPAGGELCSLCHQEFFQK